ncbi:glycerol-3-phosphate 1-O-acyltransferase PlsY [Christensenella timonensis]|uniref:glycerol-3-phosphate 1-O-acyltransferase PlsY n=1 Tax=Christensenella timonensis TaxID=1816678 RepID=UPI00083206BD|nr:glycerol-3-phosphate 1-O-acyltransferase PlsY [Christensenella timonensis]
MEVWVLILCAVIAYVLGSVSFSYIFTKKVRHEDIREKGSGNAGTTNVLRNYGWGLGIAVFAGDVLKAVAAALIGGAIAGYEGLCVAGVFAIVGHNYSCFLKFKGGKGIASTIGVLLLIQPIPTLVIFTISIIIVACTKIMSIGSIIGLILSAIAAIVFAQGNWFQILSVLIIAVLGVFSHRENIKRLIHGTEHKLSLSKK